MLLTRFVNYLKETRAEMAQVSWPSRKETINLTIVVVVVSLVTAAFLGLFDYIFSLVLQKFIL